LNIDVTWSDGDRVFAKDIWFPESCIEIENQTVAVSGLLNAVNDEILVNKMLTKAFATMEDKQVCKLRRGLKVSFYCK